MSHGFVLLILYRREKENCYLYFVGHYSIKVTWGALFCVNLRLAQLVFSTSFIFHLDWSLTWGGGLTRICCCHTGQFATMRAAKCGKFLAYFRHNFRPVKHYGMVTKRWNIAKYNCRVDVHTYYKATDIWEAYCSRFGPITDFRFSGCKGSPDELGKFSYLGQIDLKIALKWP